MTVNINIYSTGTEGWNKVKNWFSFLQKVFSSREMKRLKMKIKFNDIPTHTSGDAFAVRGKRYIFEAIGKGAELSLWYKPKYVFRFTAVPETIQEEVMDSLIKEFLHKDYAYFQTLSYVKRFLLSFFRKDTRNCGTLFTADVNCTEVYYWFLHKCASRMKWSEDIKFIEQWTSSMVYPLDILIIEEYLSGRGVGELEVL